MKKIGALLDIILIIYAIGWVSKFFSASESEQKAPEPAFYAQSGGEIASKDWLGYKNLLLVGVNAPVPPKTSADKGEPFGKEAKEFVDTAIKNGNLYLESAGDWRGYKYFYAWTNKPANSSDETIRRQMINALVIEKGYAKYDPKQNVPNVEIAPSYAKILSSAQKEAQDADAGIWSLPENSKEARAKAEAIKRQKIEEAKKERLERAKELNTVAVTGGSKIYHELHCGTIKKSYRTMTVKQALTRGYRPCKVCAPPHEEVKPDDLPLWVDLDE